MSAPTLTVSSHEFAKEDVAVSSFKRGPMEALQGGADASAAAR